MRVRLTAAALGLAMAAAVFLLTWPVYEGIGNAGVMHRPLIEMNGWWAIVPVMIPVLIALAPLAVRRHSVRIAAAIVMGVFVFISGFTIGVFYLPSGMLLLLAACVEETARLRDLW